MAHHRHTEGRFIMRRVVTALFLLVTFIGVPTIAQAFDIPLLTWERGREQQVVLGGGAYSQNWTVTLEGNGQEKSEFSASEKNDAGYVVYSITLPNDFPTGEYTVVTEGKGSPRTVVAGVQVIEAVSHTVSSNLFDLTLIIAIFAGITSIFTTLRSRKYLYIPLTSEQVLPRLTDPIHESDSNFWDRLERAPYRIRVQFLTSLKPSLLRFMLIREGEMVHRLSPTIYGVSPLVGLGAGAIAAIEVSRNNGIALTPMTVFIAVAALAIADATAGVTATLGFWAVMLFTGNVTSFHDVLIALAVGISWVGPSLFAGLLREAVHRDFASRTVAGQDPVKLLGVLGSSGVGAVVFYFGQALVSSITYTQSSVRSISITDIAIVATVLIIRGFADGVVMNDIAPDSHRDESFYIARTNSPLTAFLVASSIFSFAYIWTSSAQHAAFVSVIFTAPYVLAFIRFNPIKKLPIERLPRYIIGEGMVVLVVVFIIFRQVSMKPLLVDQRANLFMILAGLPTLLHALYGAIYSSNEAKFSFDENKEIMKP